MKEKANKFKTYRWVRWVAIIGIIQPVILFAIWIILTHKRN